MGDQVAAGSELSVVLGAGPVGRALAAELVAAGRDVRVVTRSGSADVAEGVEVRAADIASAEQAAQACAGAATVFGCVGFDYADWPRRWPPTMAGMLAGAEAAGARFVFMDNLYMYGPVDQRMREDMPLTDYGKKPAVRAELTRMWREAHDAGRVEAGAVRASDFYGPGVINAVLGEIAFGRLARGKPAMLLGDPDLQHSFAYVPDVARALLAVAGAPDAMGRAWHAPHAPDRTPRELIEMFAERIGAEPRVRTMPNLAITLLGPFNANVRELKEMLYQWKRPFRVDDSDFEQRFGQQATPFERGLSATAEWWGERA